MKNLKKAKIIFIFSLVIAVLIAGGIGYGIGNRNFQISIKNGDRFIRINLNQPRGVDFSLFWDAYNQLKENYLGDIDAQKFLYGAISGAYASLGDPYTVFLPPDLSADFQKELSGELEGIGVKIGILDDYPAVIAPLDGSPAALAGLRPKDKILKVDDFETKDAPLDLVVSKIRGPEGTTVKLTVLRDNESKTREFEIKRAKIEVKTVEMKTEGDVAILSISEFGMGTTEDFAKAVQNIQNKDIHKIILDLRNNPGGLLDGAVEIGDFLFPKDTTIVIEQNKNGKKEYKTKGQGELKNTQVVVLVNGGSASAAEILAGAIQDLKRGKIIGEKTFGKGTVQQLSPLKGDSSVKITVAKWLTPAGHDIEKNGINPDIEVKENDNPLFSSNDPVIKKALEELK
jgi:carboxyl-terminal processing protease